MTYAPVRAAHDAGRWCCVHGEVTAMGVLQQPAPTRDRRLVTRAWVCVGMVPLGLAASVGVLVGLATLLDVDLTQARGTDHTSLAKGLLLASTITVVALAAPTLAVIFSVRAKRAGQPSAQVATVVSLALFAVTGVAFTAGVAMVGLVGIAVAGLVMYLALRPHEHG